MRRSLWLYVLVLLFLPRATEARTYSADRFDSRIEVAPGGSLRVTETIALTFESGTYSQFFRAIPTQRTDGVEIISAAMDGSVWPVGEGPGRVQISGSDRVRVTWHFAPVSNSTHIFQLVYVVRGAIWQDADHDRFGWRLLPSEHDYRIASATGDISFPVTLLARPLLQARRVGESTASVDGGRVTVFARDIRANGFVDLTARLPRGAVVQVLPLWQQRSADVRRLAPAWLVASGLIVLSGLAALFFVRQRYDPPPREFGGSAYLSSPPDNLPPALAGLLLTNGSPRLEHAMAAMISLADRGEISITEGPRALGHRVFTIKRTPTGRPLTSYEQALFDIILPGDSRGVTVTLGAARNRLVRRFKRFAVALEPAISAAGLIDPDRRSVRRRFGWIAALCGIAAGLSPLALGIAAARFGAWPFFIAVAFGLVALTAVIAYAAHTPLSNDAVRRAAAWRGFRHYLRDVARDRESPPGDAAIRGLLAFAIALGVGATWSVYLKRHRTPVPPWFRATSEASASASVAFAAFVASGGTGVSGHAGTGGAGVAGGGASGAS